MAASLVVACAFVYAFAAGCANSQGQRGLEETPERASRPVEDRVVELPKPEKERYGTLDWPPPVWLVSGGEAVQASYGEYCELDVCGGEVVPKQPGGDLVSAEVPAEKEATVVVGDGSLKRLTAGVVGWDDAPKDRSYHLGISDETGVPYFMRALDIRPASKEEERNLRVAGEGPGEGLSAFELASTRRPGDRILSVFLQIGGDPASYHWRLNPGQAGENPPPPKEEFPGTAEDIFPTPETVTRPENTIEKKLPVENVEKIPFGREPGGIEYGEAYLWVQDGSGLLKVDPATAKVVWRTKLDRNVWVMEVGAGAVWAADDRRERVLRLDPETGETLHEIPVSGMPGDIAATPEGIWVANYGEERGGTLTRIEPETNEVVAEIKTPGVTEVVAVDDGTGDVWTVASDYARNYANEPDNQLVRIDAERDEITARYAVEGGVGDVAAGEGTTWIQTDGGLRKIDPESGKVEISLPFGAAGAEIGAGSLWHANQGRVTRVDLRDGRVLGSLELGEYNTDGIAVGEGTVWVVGTGTVGRGGTLTRITP